MKKKKSILLGSVLCLSFLAATQAEAATRKYAGSTCKPLPGAGDFGYDAYDGAVYGTAIFCPFAKGPLTALDSVTVRLRDESALLNSSCTIYGEYVSGSTISQYTDSASSSGSGYALQTLTLGGLSAAPYAFAICTQVSNGRVASFSVIDS